MFQFVKRKYFQFELGNWEMAEEEEEEEDENKHIRPRERALGQKTHNLFICSTE